MDVVRRCCGKAPDGFQAYANRRERGEKKKAAEEEEEKKEEKKEKMKKLKHKQKRKRTYARTLHFAMFPFFWDFFRRPFCSCDALLRTVAHS